MNSPDLDQACAFLGLLDPDADAFTFQTFDDSPAKSKSLAKVYHGALDELREPLTRLQAAGAGVFVTINETNLEGRKKADVVRVRAVFADLDGSPLQPVLACGLEPHVTVESSPGRWHAYWIVDGLALEQFAAIQKAIIARFNGDPAIHDLNRVMRVPGFYHLKAEQPFMTRIHGISDRMPYTAAQILAELPPPQPKAKTNGATKRGQQFAADSPFRAINSAALADLDAWVPTLFPEARPANDGYRVSSADLGRDLEEDLSITPEGIKDFGVHDLGDPRKGKRTPIDVVIEFGGEPDATAAARWLAIQLGVEIETADHSLSHDALALDMAELWLGSSRHAAIWGRWLVWADELWSTDETLVVMSYTRQFLRNLSRELITVAEEAERKASHDNDSRTGKENSKVAAVSSNGGSRP